MDPKEMGSKGGKARAAKLSAAERSEIARNAALERWEVPKATHTGELQIGNLTIPCAVLEDGTRVLTQWGFYRAIGRSGRPRAGWGSGIEKVAPFLSLRNLKPFVSKDLADSTKPIVFRLPKGGKAYGYRAELLPKVCEVYLKARDDGALLATQLKFATACDILMRGLAHVGIAALVDEATGYQEIRDRKALQAILDKYITDEWARWTKTFSDDFYREMFRLRSLEFPVPAKPAYIGHLTNDVVYSRLAPGVLKALREKNPRRDHGARKRKHHQHLTRDLGHPALTEHLAKVTFLMKACTDWREFKKKLSRASPKFGDTIPLDLDD